VASAEDAARGRKRRATLRDKYYGLMTTWKSPDSPAISVKEEVAGLRSGADYDCSFSTLCGGRGCQRVLFMLLLHQCEFSKFWKEADMSTADIIRIASTHETQA
jgi:hypothetical protein